MSDTSAPAQSGWSLETAIHYLLSVIAGNDKRYEERFAASQKALELGLAGTKSEISVALAAADRAVQKAEAATEKRFESVNEFRGALDNQQRTLIPRAEVDKMFQAMTEKVDRLQKQADALSSERAGLRGGWGAAVGVVGFVLVVVTLIWRISTP